MEPVTPGSSKDTEAIEKNATPSTIQNDFDVICETRFRRNFLVLIVSSILSILLCWPIGVIAAWKSFKIRKYAKNGEAKKAQLTVADVKSLLCHALGWGTLLWTALTVVFLVQYLYVAHQKIPRKVTKTT